MSNHRSVARAFADPVRYAAEPGEEMAAWHRALHEHPDQAPVYADWLEESGLEAISHVVRNHDRTDDLWTSGNGTGYYYDQSPIDQVGSGGWLLGAVKGVGDHFRVSVTHPSLVVPNRYFHWTTPYIPREQAVELATRVRGEGGRISPYDAAVRLIPLTPEDVK